MKWMPDFKVEQTLRDAGFTWKLKFWRFDQIDMKKSLNNHARIGESVNQERVDDYAAAMTAGDDFPAGVITELDQPVPNGFVLDGIQRIHAGLKIGEEGMEFYTVDNTGDLITRALPREFNTKGAWTLTREDKILHGIFLQKEFGWTGAQTAKHMRMSSGAYNEGCRQLRVKDNLEDLHVPVKALKKTHLKLLSAIDNEAVQLETANVMAKEKLSTEESNELMTAIRTAKRSESAQIEAVKAFRQRLKTGSKSPAEHATARLFGSRLRVLLKMTANITTLNQLQVTEYEAQQAMRQTLLLPLSKWFNRIVKETK